MKKFLLSFLFSINLIFAFTQDYFVGFFGERPNIRNASAVGHAFIGIGKGTPLACNVDGTETEIYGFYPDAHLAGGLSYWFGPVDGHIANDVFTTINTYYFKKIDFSDYIKVQLKMSEWKTKQYQLTRQDCISFFIEAASIFPTIKIPNRNTFVLPNDFVNKFIYLNNPNAIH
ncbi:hypothetical protein BH10BAC3_BH10BAC3_12050 [soil metagenome]